MADERPVVMVMVALEMPMRTESMVSFAAECVERAIEEADQIRRCFMSASVVTAYESEPPKGEGE